MQTLISKNEQLPETEQLLRAHLAQAWQGVLKQDVTSAMASAQKASIIAPESPDVAHVLGLLASRDGRSDLALPLLQKALNGGVTERRLRDMAEALLMANQPQAALAPITDAIKQFGESAESLGLLSAVQVALEDFVAAKASAKRAIALKPHLIAWDSNLGFCELITQQYVSGFKALTGRAENLLAGSRAPVLQFVVPCELWLKNEQGPGDTIFNLRYAPVLVEKGFKLHIQTDKKTKSLLRDTGLFASVKEEFTCPANAFWLNVGDLPLAAIQVAGQEVAPSLALLPDADKVQKLRDKLAKIGPAPYIAVTWRAGPRGKKQRNGLRMFSKNMQAHDLGKALSNIKGTVISVQRVPEADENTAFKLGLGRDFVDFSVLNDKLQDMLALLSVVDQYVAVPNTNVHLRESLGLSTEAFVNRPFQDWRWLATGDASPWYPKSYVYRQPQSGDWADALTLLQQRLSKQFSVLNSATNLNQNSQALQNNQALNVAVAQDLVTETLLAMNSDDALNSHLKPGWTAVNNADIAEAIKVAQSVLKQRHEYPPALHLLGWAAYRDGKDALAQGVLQRAVELAPTNGRITGDFIRILTANKQTDLALNIASFAIDDVDMQNKAAIFYARAAIYTQLNKLHEALADYDACLNLTPNSLDALCYSGMVRLKLGDANTGFKYYSARPEARLPSRSEGHVCPWLRGDLTGLKVLVKRDMGLGDELTYLRYLPWLSKAGVQVDYWAGHKLVPMLTRMGYASYVLSDQTPLPNTENYDLTIWVHELPVAVEQLSAPEIAPPLPLTPRVDLVEKWQAWLTSCGSSPYVGINWRAGVAAKGTATAFSKLAKAIDDSSFAQMLSPINATFISLQRNVMIDELNAFKTVLGAPLHDASALTDDIEDLLALLSLLDENVGVSNTNMHLRAGLGLGSKVLVQNPGGDWRWGYEGNQSVWFSQSQVYRQSLSGDWANALQTVQHDLVEKYGLAQKNASSNVVENVQKVTRKRCIWLTAGQVQETPIGKTSDMASTRYRVLMPMQALQNKGWQCVVVNEGLSQIMGGWGNAVPQAGDVLVVSKVFTEHALTLAKDAKARGAVVIADFCDDFLNHPKRGPLQHALLCLADKVFASTEAMAETIQTAGYQVGAVITDAVEAPKGDIYFKPAQLLKLMWFGHAVNLDTLAAFLPQLANYSKTQALTLNIVTTLPNGVADLAKFVPVGLNVTYTPWSVEATQQAMQTCDLVVIPTLTSDTKKVKSPNRLLEPLWAGRFVVAGQLPSYLPFGDSAWVGDNLIQGLDWAINHPQEVEKRIAQGQADIAEFFSTEAVGQAWQQAILSPKKAQAKAVALAQATEKLDKPKRLNLGCGDKILPDYVNVDVVASRAGKVPDVMCDLHQLTPFEDNSVDEILSVHVVEHFWRWEVLDILKEWVRVLKPGGKMILECPNLKSACEEFLRNPEAAAFGGPEGQRSMWVFYGDPRWQDPYMVHRWGYTPDSLAKLMQEAGLVNAHQAPAEYKLREPRDMRIVAEKPLI
jgi:tetratricopeptide (TPR) repeat protein/SAM-dependent methyltransferase